MLWRLNLLGPLAFQYKISLYSETVSRSSLCSELPISRKTTVQVQTNRNKRLHPQRLHVRLCVCFMQPDTNAKLIRAWPVVVSVFYQRFDEVATLKCSSSRRLCFNTNYTFSSNKHKVKRSAAVWLWCFASLLSLGFAFEFNTQSLQQAHTQMRQSILNNTWKLSPELTLFGSTQTF
jgi:hypothetical protein